MIKDTTRTLKTLLALFAATGGFAGCASETTVPSDLDVGGQSAELRDGDGDGHDDYDDQWRCQQSYGKDKHNRNKCPSVQAVAQPPAVKVGQSTRLKGFAFDNDGPRSLKYTWSAAPADLGQIANGTSKRTTFKCVKPGKAVVTLTVTDGDCTRSATTTVECQGTTAPSCGDGAKNGNETCDDSSPNAADKCPASCNDNVACTTDTLTGSASSCNAVCAHAPVAACVSGDSCCPSGCANPADNDCQPKCGDGVKNGTELCDGTGADKCPTSCDDGDACTKDTLNGSAATCNAVCSHEAIPGCGVKPCGNGVKDGSETCDNSSPNAADKCPTSCDDSQACTTDTLAGSAATCDVTCKHDPITVCANGDGCCAPGCTDLNDNSCTSHPVVCGDGKVEGTEKCDTGASSPVQCPTSCNDNNACTTDTLVGSATQCTAVCTNTAITACSLTSDGCCAPGCNANNDADCVSVCGNGVVEAAETCDPAATDPAKKCPTSCNDGVACTTDKLQGDPTKCTAVCVATPITTCTNSDGCCAPGCKSPTNGGNDNDCQAAPTCGDGVLQANEKCDDSTSTKCPTSCNDNNPCTQDVLSGSAASCSAVCSHTPVTTCSTGATGDQCCPAGCNANNDADCVPSCGNGAVETSELCDNGAGSPKLCPLSVTDCNDNDACTTDTFVAGTDTCHNTCAHAPVTTGACVCGNGKVDSGETCDGATDCQALIDACNDHNSCTTDDIAGSAATCNVVCTHSPVAGCTQCGNGIVEAGETCDTGAASPTKCPTSCTAGTDACNPVVLQNAGTCTATCAPKAVNVCQSGDGCCPTAVSCTNAQDAECAPSGPVECGCEKTNAQCADQNAAARCDKFGTALIAAGPGAGKSKALVCRQILECFHTSHCGANFNDSDCYCGASADGSDNSSACFAGSIAAAGPCKALVEQGAESTLVSDIAQRYSNATYAVGAALNILENCDYLYCNECL